MKNKYQILFEKLKEKGINMMFTVSNDLILDFAITAETNGIELIGGFNEENLPSIAGAYAKYGNKVSVIAITEGFGINKMINSIVASRVKYDPILFLVINKTKQDLIDKTKSNKRAYELMLESYDIEIIEMKDIKKTSSITNILERIEYDKELKCITFTKEDLLEQFNDKGEPADNSLSLLKKENSQKDQNMIKKLEKILESKKKVALLIGNQINRTKNGTQITTFCRNWNINYMTLPSSKSKVDEKNENYLGTFYGDFTPSNIIKKIDITEYIIWAGVEDYYYDKGPINGNDTIWQSKKILKIGTDDIENIGYKNSNISDNNKTENIQSINISKNLCERSEDSIIYEKDLLQALPIILEKQKDKNKAIISDVGITCLCSLEIKLEQDDIYLGNHASSSMGLSLASAIGIAFALPEYNIWVIVGDGSLIMSLDDISFISKYALNIKILLLDNKAYLTENIRAKHSINETPKINWELTASGLGLTNYKQIQFVDQLKKHLNNEAKRKKPSFTHLVLGKTNLPKNVQNYFLNKYMDTLWSK